MASMTARYTVFAAPSSATQLYATWDQVATDPRWEENRLRRLHGVPERSPISREHRSRTEAPSAAGHAAWASEVPEASNDGHSMLLLPPTQRSIGSQAVDSQRQSTLDESDSYAVAAPAGQSANAYAVPEFAFHTHALTRITEAPEYHENRQPLHILGYVADLGKLRDVRVESRRDVQVINVTLADASGGFLAIVAWNEQARVLSKTIRLNDVVFLSCIQLRAKGETLEGRCTARSQIQVCYRVVRRSDADDEYRPDVRLGFHAPSNAVRSLVDIVERDVLKIRA